MSIFRRIRHITLGMPLLAVLVTAFAAPVGGHPTTGPAIRLAASPSTLLAAADTCKTGFVWREARSSDHVCVTPAQRTVTASENSAAGSRVAPDTNGYGPKACMSGFVWREAYAGDTVCVTPASRTRAKADNAAAAQRVAQPATPSCHTVDGIGGGTAVAGSPTRYRAPGSPYLGVRYDQCSLAITLYFGTDATTTHYNVAFSGFQRQQIELTGPSGARQASLMPSRYGSADESGILTVSVQSCQRTSVGVGPLSVSSKSVCSAWSPGVRLNGMPH